MKINNDKMRAKLKMFKDRERRDQEAAEAALREAQEMEEAKTGVKAGGLTVGGGGGRLKGKSNNNLGANKVTSEEQKIESDGDESMFNDDFGGEVPTYKKAMREQYERAINNYA
jgi:hypothetical protein